MSATYLIRFDDGAYLYVNSADTRSLKTKDIQFAYRKARKKAETRRQAINPKAKAVEIRCVG